MKVKFSKRLLSFFLAILMIVTTIPAFSLTASAATTEEVKDKYLFAYFTGNETKNQTIKYAVSDDGVNFYKVNGGAPVIVQTLGTRCARDPYITQGPDGTYYCIATDMNAETIGFWDKDGNQNSFIVWKSTDLINWTNETKINISELMGGNKVYRCWAPELIWDESYGDNGGFMIYLSIAADGYAKGETGYNTHMYYMYTDDLFDQKSYVQPKPVFNKCDTTTPDNIDGDIVKINNDLYYMFFKDEATKTICVAKSTAINDSYDLDHIIKLKVGTDVGGLEGCQVYKNTKGEYILIADRYSENGSFAMYNFGTDLVGALGAFPEGDTAVTELDITGKKVNDTNLADKTNLGARHGSVINITTAQYNALQTAEYNAYDLSTAPGDGVDLTNDLIAHYLVNDATTDETGKGHNLTAVGNVEWINKGYERMFGVASFTDGNYLYTDQFKSILSEKTGFSVSFLANTNFANNVKGRLFETTNQPPKSYQWADGTTQNKLLSVLANDEKASVQFEGMTETDNWNDGRFGTAYTAPGYNSWHHYTFTYDSSTQTISMYQDAAKKFEISFAKFDYDRLMSQLSYLIIGATSYQDATYTGKMRDFRVYGRAITETEALNLTAQYYKDMQDEINSVAKTFEETVKALDPAKHYTGLAEAYDAYVAYNKALDSYKYGGRTDIDLSQYISNLKTATDKITEVTVSADYNASSNNNSVYGSFSGDKPQDDSTHAWGDYYKNLVYAQTGSGDERAWGNIYDGMKFCIYYPAVTMIYDGTNELSSTVMLRLQNTDNNSTVRKIYYAELANTEFTFGRTYWNGSDGSTNFRWLYGTDADNNKDDKGLKRIGTSSTTEIDNGYTGQRWTTLNWYFANLIKVNSNLDFNGKYLLEIKPSINVYAGTKTEKKNVTLTGGEPIRIVNYKAYKDAIDNLNTKNASVINYIKNIDSYKQGGLSNMLTDYNNVISKANVDITKFFGGNNGNNNYADCVKAIEDSCNAINGFTVTAPTTDIAGYQDIRNTFDNKSITKQYTAGNTGYTTDSWNAFVSAYDSAQDVMNVLDTGYNHSDAATYATNLQTAYANLETNFKPVSNANELSTLINTLETKLLSDDNADYFLTAEKVQQIVAKIDEAKATVWNGNYDITTSLIEDSPANRETVQSYVDDINVLVGELTVNFDHIYKADGGSYSINSALELSGTLDPAHYSNYKQFETAVNALSDTKAELSNPEKTPVTAGSIPTIIDAYNKAIQGFVDAYRALTYAFTMIPDGTVANSESSKAITQLSREDNGKSYVDFSYTPNAVIFKTTRDASVIPYGDAYITFSTDIRHDNNALDSISINATAKPIDGNHNIQSDNQANPKGLSDAEKQTYAGSLTNGAFALSKIYYDGRSSINNASPFITMNDGTQITFEPTAKQTELSQIIGVTDGSSTNPVAGGVFACNNGGDYAKSATYIKADMTLSVPATEKVDLTADTKPVRTSYTTGDSYFGALVAFHIHNIVDANWAGYSWLTTQQTGKNGETINFKADVIDITNLIDLVELTASLPSKDYTTTSYNALATALDAARANMDYTTMKSDQILTACEERYTNLWTAYKALVNITVYNDAIKEYNAIITDPFYEYMYSPESRNAYKDAVDAGIAMAKIDQATTQTDVDNATKAIMEAKALLKPSTLKAIVEYNGKTTTMTASYGELFTFDPAVLIGGDLSGASIVWSVDLFKPGDTANPELAIGSQKQTTIGTETFTRFANSDMVLSAQVKHTTDATENQVSLKVYNGYGNLIDIMAINKPANGTDYTEAEINEIVKSLPTVSMPFYSFAGWAQPVQESENVYSISPIFNPIGTIVIDTMVNGTKTDTVTVETNGSNNVTVTTNNSTQIYGWVVKSGEKYQIVSYSDGTSNDFKFVAITSETYYPFYKNSNDGKYHVGSTDGTVLDSTNVEAFNDTDDALNKLLDAKAPFIYVEATEAVNNDTKMRTYFRVTANASGVLGFGMTVSKDGGNTFINFAPTEYNEAGQFSMTISKSNYDNYFYGGYVVFDNNGTRTTFNNFTHKV